MDTPVFYYDERPDNETYQCKTRGGAGRDSYRVLLTVPLALA